MELEPKNSSPSLDDLYFMVSYIYSDKNAERPISSTFLHFAEVCGMLTIHAKKKNREGVSMEAALCKALGWFFPLMAKLKVKSVQELVFRKYPDVCPYCRLSVHREEACKQTLGTMNTVNHDELRMIYEKNRNQMPHSLNDWQRMFNRIYLKGLGSRQETIMSLFEELGEFAESIRIFDTHPKYVAGEAADVFSYIMAIANEYNLKKLSENQPGFDFEIEFMKRYPGLCPQCGYQVCICPIIPEATVGRMAKELDLLPTESIFNLNLDEVDETGLAICNSIVEQSGGLLEYLKTFPFDRGDTNRVIVSICIKLASKLMDRHPDIASELNLIAIKISENHKRAGVKSNDEELIEIIQVLENILPKVDLDVLNKDIPVNQMISSLLSSRRNKH